MAKKRRFFFCQGKLVDLVSPGYGRSFFHPYALPYVDFFYKAAVNTQAIKFNSVINFVSKMLPIFLHLLPSCHPHSSQGNTSSLKTSIPPNEICNVTSNGLTYIRHISFHLQAFWSDVVSTTLLKSKGCGLKSTGVYWG